MSDATYDVIVIGAGPGGYVAAIRASQLGLKAAIVERQFLGGVCLNIGCIPTKAILHSADLLEEVRDGAKFGVVTKDVTLDWNLVLKNKEQVVKQMTGGVGFLMKKNKVDVHMGTAKLSGGTNVTVTDADGKEKTLSGKSVIIATGSRPRDLPQIGAGFSDRVIWSKDALALPEVPKRLLVVGAGAIGCEFASAYRSFGSEVTLVEALPRIVPLEDEEVSAELSKAFTKRGIKVMAGAKLSKVETGADSVTATVTDASGKEVQIVADRMLLGIGVIPNTQNLGLEEVGVETDQRGFIKVNDTYQTNVPGIYAIGDCIPTPALAHVASAEAIVAAEAIANHATHAIDYSRIPSCTYCHPEVSHAGLTEAQAKEQGYDVKVSKFPFAANGKATILGDRSGFIKIVTDAKYGEVLGIHMIGPRVTELVAEAGLALSHEATAESLMSTIHAHPTLYEALGEAAHAAATGAAIHI
jgi:dihydrolipoamide dehydrogenase